MQASKIPAFAALVVAVATGALLSSGRHPTAPRVAPVEEKPQAEVPAAPAPASATTVQLNWHTTTLDWQHVRLKIDAPEQVGNTQTCHSPSAAEDEVGVCSQALSSSQPVVWRVATVTQRDRFVPAGWFGDAQKLLKASTQPQQIVDGLNAELQARTSIKLSNATTSDSEWLKNGLAIAGQATYRPSQSSTDVVTMTCFAAFILAANRPTQVLYCAQNSDQAKLDAARMVESLQKLNPSVALSKNSLQAIERATYQKLLKSRGGAASSPELVETEIQHFTATNLACQEYGDISQERYLCFEQHAKARLDQLKTLPPRRDALVAP